MNIIKTKCLLALAWGCAYLILANAALGQWSSTNIYQNWTSLAMTANGSNIAAVAFLNGIYTSTNAGVSWLNAGLPDSTHPATLTTSSNGDNLVAAFYNGGIYTSPTWGNSWQQSSAPTNTWNCLASSADGSMVVAAPAPGVIFNSRDSGATFTSRLSPYNTYQAMVSAAGGTDLVAVAFGGGIYRSADSGETWATTAAPAANWSAIASSSNGMMQAAAVFSGGIYTSTNYGSSWNLSSAPITNWIAIASSANGSNLVAAADGGTNILTPGHLYLSVDSGAHWTAANAPTNLWSALYSSPDGTQLMALANGVNNGYFSTNSGSTWSTRTIANAFGSTNFILTDTYSLKIVSSNVTTHVLTTDIYNTNLVNSAVTISGKSITVTNSITLDLSKAELTSNRLETILASFSGNVHDGQALSAVITTQLGTNLLGNKLSVSARKTSKKVLKTLKVTTFSSAFATNISNSLVTKVRGITVAITNTLNIQVALVVAGQSWAGIAASADGSHLVAADKSGPLYISTDSGATWTNVAPNQSWSAVALSADGARLVATVNGGGIYTSTNSGATWITNNVPNQYWSTISSSPDGNTLLALARSGSPFKSTDGGNTWVELNTPYDSWKNLASSADGNRLLAASSGNIYISTDGGTTWNQTAMGLNASVNCANTFTLSGIYTNSFTWAVTNSGKKTIYHITTNYFSESFPMQSSPSMIVSSNILNITNLIGLNVSGIVANPVNQTNVINAFMGGVSLQGSFVLGGQTDTNIVLGAGSIGPGVILPNSNYSNVLAVTSAIPGYGGDTQNGAIVSSNFINTINAQVYKSSSAGIKVFVTNSINVEVFFQNNWSAVASSADGTHLAAADNGGLIYISTNSGATWFATSAPVANWLALACSADGSSFVALAADGLLYTYANSGATVSTTDVPAASGGAVAISGNGSELAAVTDPGILYTEQTTDPPAPALRISIAGGNIILTWPVSSANYGLQQKVDVSGVTSWVDEPATSVVSNGYNQVALPLSPGQCLFRLRKQ